MSSKKFFSWSKRSSSEPYHRTGGLLVIDTSVGDTGNVAIPGDSAKTAPQAGRRRPPNLNLTIPYEHSSHLSCLSPASARHNAAFVNSASNLLAVVNDMLRSPALGATFCSRSAEIHKPLPSRPRSVSLPSTPDLPVELPGSILLDNQGLSPSPVAGPSPHNSTNDSTNTMRSVRSGNSSTNAAAKPTPSKVLQHKKSLSESSLQRRSKSRPNLITTPTSQSTDSKITTCSVSTNGGQTSASNDSNQAHVGAEKLLQPAPLIVEGKPWRKSGGDGSSRRYELGTPTTPTPTSARSHRIEELKSTIAAQDSTISTLQTQFGTLRKSHEAEIASLKDAHTAAVASLQDYTRVLEEQQSQRTLHHASSNHLLMLLDTTENPLSPGLQSPSRESPQTTAGNNSANSATSIRSFQSALEQQTRTPIQAKDNAEMENLKRKLSAARRPETGNRDMIRELNQYKLNNNALQKQIESLMAKLNESKKNERLLSQTLEDIEKNVGGWQEKAEKADQLEKSNSAMQNTIDHLSHRLEVANCDKLDAEEALYNTRMQQSPFHPRLPKLQVTDADLPNEAHMSMSTVFSSGSPTSHFNEAQDSSTLAAFIAHIERLQEQIKQKDSRMLEMEHENSELRDNHELLTREHHELTLQSDIQSKLLGKNKQSEIYVDQLRSAIIERESIIGEKDKSLRMAERQLEHHKLLLHSEIRRHATMSLYADGHTEPLPDLTSLASKEDIDKWITRLQARLKKDIPGIDDHAQSESPQETIDGLRKEIDFYVREIVYYKLDIKGYKSDIKKLKNIAQRMGNHSRTSDLESPTPSLSRSGDTPIRARFPSVVGSTVSNTPSPIYTGPISATASLNRPITPPPAVANLPSEPASGETIKPSVSTPVHNTHEHASAKASVPHTPTRKTGFNVANEADGIDPGISPRSIARLSPQRRKPTVRQPLTQTAPESDIQRQPPSPGQEKSGDMATNFPLSTPAAPKRMDTQRSNSDSIIQLYASPRTPEWSPAPHLKRTPDNSTPTGMSLAKRIRSSSVSDASGPKDKSGPERPERPPRPRYGLFESPTTKPNAVTPSTPPRVDIMAEAMRSSPERTGSIVPDPSTIELRGLSNSQLSRTNSTGSASAIPPPLSLRPRAGSAASSTTPFPQPTSPQRKPSDASSASIPFIIAMPSPYMNNATMVSPTTTVPPTACSITGKSSTTQAPPPKLQTSTSRTGVGGTMASSTPVTSPTTPPFPDSAKGFFSSAPKNPTSKPSSSHGRNMSLGSISLSGSRGNKDNESFNSGTIERRGHVRNASASSIRNAVQLPSSLMKGKGKARKDSISGPTPLASPFDIDRGGGIGNAGSGVGEAI